MAATSFATPQRNVDFSRKAFLIVDDFQGMRTILRDILRNCGVDAKHISTAANGREAVNALGNTIFDVVLCDFNLGPGKNGQQVLEEAKVKQLIGPACAWIMITAEKTADVVTGTAEYQPDAYLLKPLTESVLRQRLDKIWARKEAFAEIDQAMRNHNYAQAIALCDTRLAFDKANGAELVRTKGELALISGNLTLAREVYEGVLASRDVPWAKTGLAKVLIQNGKYAEARQLLDETIRDNPSFLEAHDLQATALRQLGDLEAAARSLERATRLSPNSVARQKNYGEVALRIGHAENAERAFRKSVALGEHSVLKAPDAYLGLAKACSANANPAEALKVLSQLGKEFDGEEVKLNALAVEGVVHHQSGNLDKARQVAAELGRRLSSGDTAMHNGASALDAARLLFMVGDKEQAVAVLKNQVKNSPEDVTLHNEVKAIFASAEMAEEGAEIVEVSRQEGVEMMNRGVLLARDGRYEEAIAAMRHANRALPTNVRVLLNLAYVIITRLQKVGVTPELVGEARETLGIANKLAPGQLRYVQLRSSLDAAIAAARPPA